MGYPIQQPRPSSGTTFRPRNGHRPHASGDSVPALRSTWYLPPEKLEQLRVAFGERPSD